MRAAPALALVGLALATSPIAAADPGTLSGKLTEGNLPSAATGRADVRAISARDGRILAATTVPAGGAWTLGVEPGYYLLTASVVQPGKRTVSAIAPVERVRSGRTTRTKVSLKRTKTPKPKPKRKKRSGARAAASPSPVVGITAFTGSGPNASLGRGLAEMLITEMSSVSSGDCEPTEVEMIHRQAILDEIALSNSQLANPGSRIPRGHLIEPGFLVRGSVATTATSATWTLELVDTATGNVVGGDTGSADGQAIFDAPADIAQRLADQLCGSEYKVSILIQAIVTAGEYFGDATMLADVPVRDTSGTTPPTSWLGQQPVTFAGFGYQSGVECAAAPGPHSGYAKVEIKKSSTPGLIEVQWGGETFASVDIVCPGKTIVGAGLPVMPFQGTQPAFFFLPESGGTQSLSGGLPAPGGGWVNSGTITVTRVPRGTP